MKIDSTGIPQCANHSQHTTSVLRIGQNVKAWGTPMI
jgi:hypothetical protein